LRSQMSYLWSPSGAVISDREDAQIDGVTSGGDQGANFPRAVVMLAEPRAGLNFPGGRLLWLKQSVDFPSDLVIGGVLGCVYGDCIS